MPTSRQKLDEMVALAAANWPEMAAAMTPASYWVYLAGFALREFDSRVVEAHGLTVTEFEVLSSLRLQPPPHALTPTEIYRMQMYSSGGLTKILGRLERRGLIARHANPADSRSRLAALTAAGRRCVEAAMDDLLAREAVIMADFTDEERALLSRLLARLSQRLEACLSDPR